jgi:hypothetical protein
MRVTPRYQIHLKYLSETGFYTSFSNQNIFRLCLLIRLELSTVTFYAECETQKPLHMRAISTYI